MFWVLTESDAGVSMTPLFGVRIWITEQMIKPNMCIAFYHVFLFPDSDPTPEGPENETCVKTGVATWKILMFAENKPYVSIREMTMIRPTPILYGERHEKRHVCVSFNNMAGMRNLALQIACLSS